MYSSKFFAKKFKKHLVSLENDLISSKGVLYNCFSYNYNIYQSCEIENDILIGLIYNGGLIVIGYYPDYEKAIVLAKLILQENVLTKILPKLSQRKIYKLMKSVCAGSYSCNLKTKELNASNIRRADSNNAFNHRDIIFKFFLDESNFQFDDYILNLLKNAKENLMTSTKVIS